MRLHDEMVKEMEVMRRQMDFVFHSLFGSDFGLPAHLRLSYYGNPVDSVDRYRTPLVHFEEKGKEYVVKVELPGVDKKDVDVRVEDHGVHIRVEHKDEVKKEEKGFISSVSRHFGFYRFVTLPNDADVMKLSARFDNGLLYLEVPKDVVASADLKKIEVK